MEGDIIIEKSVDLGEKYTAKKAKLAEADKAFMQALDAYLQLRPELKKRYEEKLTQKVDSLHRQQEEKAKSLDQEIEESEKINEESIQKSEVDDFIPKENPDIKRIYREIVKLTHPDKLAKKGYTEKQLKKMGEYYETATKAYENLDLLPLVRIGAILYLPMNLSPESLDELEYRVMNLESELAYIETTFAWSWYHAPTNQIKNQMLEMFLNQILIK
jgi:hypothetical protein